MHLLWLLLLGFALVSNSFANDVDELHYDVISTMQHDNKCFTQGLFLFEGNTLYESCGLNGKSSIRIVDQKTGEVIKRSSRFSRHVFSEGIHVMRVNNNDNKDEDDIRVYMLTWRSREMFVLDGKTLKHLFTVSS